MAHEDGRHKTGRHGSDTYVLNVKCKNVNSCVHDLMNSIYANISLFRSYSKGHCSHPDPVCIQPRSSPRDELYSPECQRRPGQLDKPPETDPIRRSHPLDGHDTNPQQRPQDQTSPLHRPVSPKVFFSVSITDGSLSLLPLACLVRNTLYCQYYGLDCTDQGKPTPGIHTNGR